MLEQFQVEVRFIMYCWMVFGPKLAYFGQFYATDFELTVTTCFIIHNGFGLLVS